MIQKVGPLALVLLLVGAFAVGCGGDDKSDSSNDAPAVTTTAAEDTVTDDATTDDTATTEGDVAPGEPSDAQIEQAIASCEKSIEANPSVKDDIKEDLKGICEEAATGDPEDVKAAIKEICERIVDSSVPEGDIRDQAKQACASAGG